MAEETKKQTIQTKQTDQNAQAKEPSQTAQPALATKPIQATGVDKSKFQRPDAPKRIERRSFGERKQFGKRRDRNQNQGDLDKKIISIRRVTRVYSGGKRMRLSVCLVVGDKKGKVGIAIGKGADVMAAEAKAFNKAKKKMVQIDLKGKTIAHAISYKKGAAKIILRPAAPGTGVIAGSALRAVLEAVGIEDILTKVIGSPNLINNAYACLEALQSLKKIN